MVHKHGYVCMQLIALLLHKQLQVVHATDGDKVMLSLPATSTIKEAGGSDISTMLVLLIVHSNFKHRCFDYSVLEVARPFLV